MRETEEDSTRQGTGAMAAIAATDYFKEFGIQGKRFSGKALGGGGEGVYRRKVVEKGSGSLHHGQRSQVPRQMRTERQKQRKVESTRWKNQGSLLGPGLCN